MRRPHWGRPLGLSAAYPSPGSAPHGNPGTASWQGLSCVSRGLGRSPSLLLPRGLLALGPLCVWRTGALACPTGSLGIPRQRGDGLWPRPGVTPARRVSPPTRGQGGGLPVILFFVTAGAVPAGAALCLRRRPGVGPGLRGCGRRLPRFFALARRWCGERPSSLAGRVPVRPA